MKSHCIFSQEAGAMNTSVLIKTAGQVKRETHLPQEAHAMHQTIPERAGKCCKSASTLDISSALPGIQTIHPQLDRSCSHRAHPKEPRAVLPWSFAGVCGSMIHWF